MAAESQLIEVLLMYLCSILQAGQEERRIAEWMRLCTSGGLSGSPGLF